MDIKNQRRISLGLSLISALGVAGTFIMVSKETLKAKEALDKLPEDASQLTKIKTFVKNYKYSLMISAATIASGLGSRIISNKVETSLIATATMLDAGYRKYRNSIKKTLGLDADKNALKQIMKDEYSKSIEAPKEEELLFWEEHVGYFYAKKSKILEAYSLMNEDLSGNTGGWVSTGRTPETWYTIKGFLDLCEARILSHNVDHNKLNWGWDIDYLSEFYGYYWVHMDVSEPDENGARMIYWFETPVWNPANWYDYKDGTIPKEEYFLGYNGQEIDPNDYTYKVNNIYKEEEIK